MATATGSYKGVPIAFMSWKDNENYTGYDFAPEELTDVTASHVVDWFNFQAYGTTTPGEEDHPLYARSNSPNRTHFLPRAEPAKSLARVVANRMNSHNPSNKW